MSTLVITPTTPDWQARIEEHLRAGENAYVRFEEPSLSPRELADRVGLSRAAIQRWIQEGKINTYRRGNRHRIPASEADRFVAWYRHEVVAIQADDALADLFADD